MHKQGSILPVCIAVVLSALTAVLSAPTKVQNVEDKLLWMLQTQGDADESPAGSMEALNKLGLP